MGIMDKENAQPLSTRQYIDQMVAPTLLQGLNIVATERPPDPLAFLGKFLLEKSQKKDETAAPADQDTPMASVNSN